MTSENTMVESVAISIDGVAKVGKTRLINTIVNQALEQDGILTDLPHNSGDGGHGAFSGIEAVSAGNMFRAVAARVISLEKHGHTKTEFDDDDLEGLRELLQNKVIDQALQGDRDIEKRVSTIAQMSGVHAVCGTLFCEALLEAYQANGGGNLVIVDARDPVAHMRRNDILGSGPGKIEPASIMPVYIDTPLEVAARRDTSGNYRESLENIRARREADANRSEFPVVRPDNLITDYGTWLLQFEFPEIGGEVAAPFLLDNGASVGLDSIEIYASVMAAKARELGHRLKHSS